MPGPKTDYVWLNAPNPHHVRMKKILAVHPKIKKLFGYTPSTAVYALALVSLQTLLAFLFYQTPWWLLLLGAYLIGATINHALYVVIHEATHNLIFKRPVENRLVGLFANLPPFFSERHAVF